jgi:hypothetical protein
VINFPALSPARVPGAYRSHLRTLLIATVVITVVVVAVSAIAVASSPSRRPCGVACGPHSGPALLNASSYTSQQFGYTVQYDSNELSIAGRDQAGVQLQAANGDGEVDLSGSAGSNVGGAVSNAIDSLDTSEFQNMQEIGPVRGAEIGLVLGQGTAFSANYVPSDGSGQSLPVSIVVMAAARGGVTITVIAFSAQDSNIEAAPYGLAEAGVFDFPITNTIWKGQE